MVLSSVCICPFASKWFSWPLQVSGSPSSSTLPRAAPGSLCFAHQSCSPLSSGSHPPAHNTTPHALRDEVQHDYAQHLSNFRQQRLSKVSKLQIILHPDSFPEPSSNSEILLLSYAYATFTSPAVNVFCGNLSCSEHFASLQTGRCRCSQISAKRAETRRREGSSWFSS